MTSLFRSLTTVSWQNSTWRHITEPHAVGHGITSPGLAGRLFKPNGSAQAGVQNVSAVGLESGDHVLRAAGGIVRRSEQAGCKGMTREQSRLNSGGGFAVGQQ